MKRDEILAANKKRKEETGYGRRYYAENKEYFKEKAKEYHKKNPGRKYGLTSEEYHGLVAQSGGKCSICKESFEKPYIDHDHATGRVRGVLCFHCNTVLGHAKDSVEVLRNAVRYLEM